MATKKKSAKTKPDPEKDEKNAKARGKTTDQLAKEMTKEAKPPGTVTIEKVKLVGKKDQLEVNVSVIEQDGSVTKDIKSSNRPVHKDLKSKLAAFAIHWGILLDYVNPNALKGDIKKYDEALVKNITVTSISIAGKEGEEGITITANRKTRRGKFANINTPFERFEEVQETRYKFMDDVEKKWEGLQREVELYLSGEKVGESPQGKLEFEEGSQEEGGATGNDEVDE